ncbi:MAG: hypothetical protein HYX63_01630 [Gammaproteobacteria bacterium]|nr:hypothetical protein [Gammaproteobacteria bacterium]
MPVSAQTPLNTYTGNGVATVYAYSFYLLNAADLLVTIDGVTKALTTDYTVSGIKNPSGGGGNVTFVAAPLNGSAIRIKRNMAYQRTIDYQDNGDFKAQLADDDADSITMLVQQLKRDTDLDIRLPETVSGVSATLPAPQALKLLRWNAVANALENADVAGLVPGYVTVSAFAQTLLQAVDAPGGRTTLGAAQDTAVPKLALPNVFTDTQIWKYNAIASAGALVLGAGNIFNVSGGATINTISSKGAGTLICLIFAGAQTLVNSGNLVLPAGQGIITANGDTAFFLEDSVGVWRCLTYQRYGNPVGVAPAFLMVLSGNTTASNGVFTTVPFDIKLIDTKNGCTLGAGASYAPPIAGTYLVGGALKLSAVSAAVPNYIVQINSGSDAAQAEMQAASGSSPMLNVVKLFNVVGGSMNLQIFQNSGAPQTINGSNYTSYLWGIRLG